MNLKCALFGHKWEKVVNTGRYIESACYRCVVDNKPLRKRVYFDNEYEIWNQIAEDREAKEQNIIREWNQSHN